MQFRYPRIPVNRIPEDEFLDRFYRLEKPVIITGIEPPTDGVIHSLLARTGSRPGPGFAGSPLTCESDELVVPELVRAILSRDDIVLRTRPIRLWMQARGHRTLLHYDGNSLQGLNWQVTGSKQWTLISPNTPPPFFPFHPYAMTRANFNPDADRYDFCQFVTRPGDLVFVPRYWPHEVTALEHRSSNINWVWTPRTPNLQVAIGRRECAVLAWRNLIPGLSRLILEPTRLHDYGGGGEELSRVYTEAVRGRELVRALASELARLPLLPFYYTDLKWQFRHARESLI